MKKEEFCSRGSVLRGRTARPAGLWGESFLVCRFFLLEQKLPLPSQLCSLIIDVRSGISLITSVPHAAALPSWEGGGCRLLRLMCDIKTVTEVTSLFLSLLSFLLMPKPKPCPA